MKKPPDLVYDTRKLNVEPDRSLVYPGPGGPIQDWLERFEDWAREILRAAQLPETLHWHRLDGKRWVPIMEVDEGPYADGSAFRQAEELTRKYGELTTLASAVADFSIHTPERLAAEVLRSSRLAKLAIESGNAEVGALHAAQATRWGMLGLFEERIAPDALQGAWFQVQQVTRSRSASPVNRERSEWWRALARERWLELQERGLSKSAAARLIRRELAPMADGRQLPSVRTIRKL